MAMTSSSYNAPATLLLLLLLPIVLQPLLVSSKPIATQPDRLAMEKAWDDFKWRLWFCVHVDDDSIFSDEDGLRTLFAILQRFSVKSFIWADDDLEEESIRYVPSCASRTTMYVRRMENEKELLERDSGLIDDLRSGAREVKRLRRKIVGFDGSGNFSVSGTVLDGDWKFRVDEVRGFGTLEFPNHGEEESAFKNKIELAVVAEIGVLGADEDELGKLRRFLGHDRMQELGISNATMANEDVPVTMLYSVHF